MRIQTKNKEVARSAEKREGTERKKTKQSKKPPKKPVLSSATDDIQQTPVTPDTFSSPKYCERRIPQEKCHLSKHLTCEEKGRVFFEHVMSIRHDVMRGMSHVPCTRVMMPWGRQQLCTQFEYKHT